jgi:hypothetical protein
MVYGAKTDLTQYKIRMSFDDGEAVAFVWADTPRQAVDRVKAARGFRLVDVTKIGELVAAADEVERPSRAGVSGPVIPKFFGDVRGSSDA